MKHSKKARKFVAKRKDKKIRKLLDKGGRKNAEKDFDLLISTASKPSPSSQ